MVSTRIAEMVLRDERAVIPIGPYNPDYGVTVSLPSIVGRRDVAQILEPQMSEEERQALARSAETARGTERKPQLPHEDSSARQVSWGGSVYKEALSCTGRIDCGVM